MLRFGVALAVALAATSAVAAPEQARFDWLDYRGDDGLPKPAPGQYANPILQGFYPDPSVVRVGSDYYLVNSTFGWFPGIPVWHSRDLVSWKQIGNAIDRPGQLRLHGMSMGQGVFAPDISWHDGTFYILNTCIGCGGNFLITAKNPAGPWSDPVFLPEVDGIDTSMFFDSDGSAWIVHNAPPPGKPEYEGHTAIWLQQLDLKTLKTFGTKRVLVDKGTHPERKPIWIEAPHIFRKDGFYYLIAAEGGTAEQHSEVVFRSDRVTGPYIPFAGNPILTQRDLPADRPQPITSTGHAGFVQTPAGEWWAVFLGVRPYDAQNFNTGRETFLSRVTWQDGWPRVTEPGQRVPWVERRPNLPKQPAPKLPTSGAFSVRQDFSSSALPLGWMMLGEPHERWWRIGGGQLSLDARADALGAGDQPSLLARRQQHLNFVATTKVAFVPPSDDAEAGLVAMQSPDWWYGVLVGREKGRRLVQLRRRAGGSDPVAGTVLASAALPTSGATQLRVEGHGGSYRFSFSSDGEHWRTLLADADGTILSTKRAGGFVGAVVGLYAHDGAPIPKK